MKRLVVYGIFAVVSGIVSILSMSNFFERYVYLRDKAPPADEKTSPKQN
jgi:hypothetical protein